MFSPDPVLNTRKCSFAIDSQGERFRLYVRAIPVLKRSVRVTLATLCSNPRGRLPAPSYFRAPLPLRANVSFMARIRFPNFCWDATRKQLAMAVVADWVRQEKATCCNLLSLDASNIAATVRAGAKICLVCTPIVFGQPS